MQADLHFFALLCFYFRANASKAKHCRSKSLRCTTFPSQITSALFSAIPSPCPSVLLSAFASHSFALPSLFIAVQCCSVALPCYALPLHSSSPHSLCHAPRCFAMPLPRPALLRYAFAALSIARPIELSLAIAWLISDKRCFATAKPFIASANQGRQCHALALRASPHRQCR